MSRDWFLCLGIAAVFWGDAAVHNWREMIIRKFMALSSFRKALVGLLLVAVPILISAGWAVQAPNMVKGATAAIWLFAFSAAGATIFFWLWEEIAEQKPLHRRIAVMAVGIVTLTIFRMGANWSVNMAFEAANDKETEIAQSTYLRVQEDRFFHQRLTCPALVCPSSSAAKTPKPDLLLRLVWKKGFSVLMVGAKSVVKSPEYSIAIWDLELPGPQTLQGQYTNSFEKAWIKPGSSLGPMPYMTLPAVAAVVKPGDRLFGFMFGSCPECERTRVYWIYAKNGESGWFAELPQGQYPSLTKIFTDIEAIKRDPESYLTFVPQSARVPIEDLP